MSPTSFGSFGSCCKATTVPLRQQYSPGVVRQDHAGIACVRPESCRRSCRRCCRVHRSGLRRWRFLFGTASVITAQRLVHVDWDAARRCCVAVRNGICGIAGGVGTRAPLTVTFLVESDAFALRGGGARRAPVLASRQPARTGRLRYTFSRKNTQGSNG